MQKPISLFLLALIACTCWAAPKKRMRNISAENYHFGYVSVAGGYSSLSQRVPNVVTLGEFAYMFGAGYEFRYDGMWVSVGAQYQHLRSKTISDLYTYTHAGIDDQNKGVTFMYDINQTDRQDWKTIDVPIMMGYYNHGFYAGLGAKVGFSLNSFISTEGTYNLRGDYDKYVGVIHDVNWYKSYPFDATQYECPLRPQFSLLGEIGYDLLSSIMTNSRFCHVLNVGFYFEYGLRSVRPKDSVEPLTINKEDARMAGINPIYLSTQTEGKRVVPFFVGVKLTYMFGGSRNASGTWHRGCQCYQ